jgi:hypothetical protein
MQLANSGGFFYHGAFMRTKLLTALLCGFVLVGQIRSQEVVVAREAKPNPAKQPMPASENRNFGSGKSTKAKPQAHAEKSGSAPLTIEEMRMAGALAAERLKGQSHVEPASATEGSNSEAASTPVPTAFAVAKPARKEPRIGQTSSSRASNSRNPKSEVIGSVRPSMIETGREMPDTSSPIKGEVRDGQRTAPQSANRSLRKQEAIVAAE